MIGFRGLPSSEHTHSRRLSASSLSSIESTGNPHKTELEGLLYNKQQFTQREFDDIEKTLSRYNDHSDTDTPSQPIIDLLSYWFLSLLFDKRRGHRSPQSPLPYATSAKDLGELYQKVCTQINSRSSSFNKVLSLLLSFSDECRAHIQVHQTDPPIIQDSAPRPDKQELPPSDRANSTPLCKTRKGFRSGSVSFSSVSPKKIKKPSLSLTERKNIFKNQLQLRLYALFQTAIIVDYGKLELGKSRLEDAASVAEELTGLAPGGETAGKLLTLGVTELKKKQRKKRYRSLYAALEQTGDSPWDLSVKLAQSIHDLIQHYKELPTTLKALKSESALIVAWIARTLKQKTASDTHMDIMPELISAFNQHLVMTLEKES
ncbi:hypothetical protein DID77_03075 [Candidatus Marinamargulisbacteria bacterium SCGC AG-439-L15]|nr:hypothetical protein DID77_03075 [Candidatus Marinamargulisbacteria bacterium SCGC AG-439-L15]